MDFGTLGPSDLQLKEAKVISLTRLTTTLQQILSRRSTSRLFVSSRTTGQIRRLVANWCPHQSARTHRSSTSVWSAVSISCTLSSGNCWTDFKDISRPWQKSWMFGGLSACHTKCRSSLRRSSAMTLPRKCVVCLHALCGADGAASAVLKRIFLKPNLNHWLVSSRPC